MSPPVKIKAVNKVVNKKGINVRIEREDVSRASEKAVNTDLRQGFWLIYAEGDYHHERNPQGARYVVTKHGQKVPVRMGSLEYYRPLLVPDLFLRFARLKLEAPYPGSWSDSLVGYPFIYGEFDYGLLDTDKNAEEALKWARGYGTLGLTPGSPPRDGGEPFRSGGNPSGGPDETVWRFVVESQIAHRTLRLYEAATSPKGVDVEAFRELGCNEPLGSGIPFGGESPESARGAALEMVARMIERMVTDRCHPTLRRKKDGIAQGWGFKDLLGAMWLQAMWLVNYDSGRRCQRPGCNGVIDIKKPKPEELTYTSSSREGGKLWRVPRKYKTRDDKIYCTDSCKTLAWRERKRAQEA